MSIPPLPSGSSHHWSSNIIHTVQILQDVHSSATSVLSRGDQDIHRLQWHQTNILTHALPLLQNIHECAEEEGLPPSWVHECVEAFGNTVVELANAELSAKGEYVNVLILDLPYIPL